jgi:hypothetical protein
MDTLIVIFSVQGFAIGVLVPVVFPGLSLGIGVGGMTISED